MYTRQFMKGGRVYGLKRVAADPLQWAVVSLPWNPATGKAEDTEEMRVDLAFYGEGSKPRAAYALERFRNGKQLASA